MPGPSAFAGYAQQNRALSGSRSARGAYDVIAAPVENGKATDVYMDLLAGFVTPDGAHSYTCDAGCNLLTVDAGNMGSYVCAALNRRVSVQNSSGQSGYLSYAFDQRVFTQVMPQNFGLEGDLG